MDKRVREEIELAVLSFAHDYHRFETVRRDIALRGIKSHPKFIDQIKIKISEEIEKSLLTDGEVDIASGQYLGASEAETNLSLRQMLESIAKAQLYKILFILD